MHVTCIISYTNTLCLTMKEDLSDSDKSDGELYTRFFFINMKKKSLSMQKYE